MRPRFDLRARRQRHAAEQRGAPRRGSDHAEQHASGLIDVVERDQPTLLLHPQPICQRHAGALNSVFVEHPRGIGELAGLLQQHALKRDGFLVKRKLRTGNQRRSQGLFDVCVIGGAQVDLGDEAVDAVRHHALEQGGLVRDQTVKGLGGDPSPARHRFDARRGIAIAGEFVPRGLVDHPVGFVVGADLGPSPAALVLGGVDLSHVFT